MKKKYQSRAHKSNHKFEVIEGQELRVRVPLPMTEVWAEMPQHRCGSNPMCNNPEVLTYDWMKMGGRSVSINTIVHGYLKLKQANGCWAVLLLSELRKTALCSEGN